MNFKYLILNADDTWEWKEENVSNPYAILKKELGSGYFPNPTLHEDLILFYDDYDEHGEELNNIASFLCLEETYGKCLLLRLDNRGLNKYKNRKTLFPKLRSI